VDLLTYRLLELKTLDKNFVTFRKKFENIFLGLARIRSELARASVSALGAASQDPRGLDAPNLLKFEWAGGLINLYWKNFLDFRPVDSNF
jgi:hypothetical protein